MHSTREFRKIFYSSRYPLTLPLFLKYMRGIQLHFFLASQTLIQCIYPQFTFHLVSSNEYRLQFQTCGRVFITEGQDTEIYYLEYSQSRAREPSLRQALNLAPSPLVIPPPSVDQFHFYPKDRNIMNRVLILARNFVTEGHHSCTT